jgi:prefoldin alpha subunit
MGNEEKEMQEKFVMYQLMQKQLEAFREQAVQLERGFIEVETTNQILGDLKNIKVDNEIMIPLGSGCFVEGKITNKKNVLMSPGSNLMFEKDLKSAKEGIAEKRDEIEKMIKDIQKKINDVAQEINHIGAELEKMATEAQK